MKKPNQIRDSEVFTSIGIIGVGILIIIISIAKWLN
tara:strand:+ start:530 stop:637 length:108 start_codon:yes stop_codon:yes gene_type:complete